MLSGDSGQGESVCTPRSISKKLFGPGGSSTKRNLFGQESKVSKDTSQLSGGDESDLGPMSPLALTDGSESSCESSSGRSFVSPFTSPVKSPRDISGGASWDRLRPNSLRDKSKNYNSTFDTLKSLTKAARTSPKRKIAPVNLSKSLPVSPNVEYFHRESDEEEKQQNQNPNENQIGLSPCVINTPEYQMALLFNETDIVPETPRRREKSPSINTDDDHDDDRIEETPRKGQTSDGKQRQTTPLSCVQKREMIVPRLHRRKSLCLFDTNDEQSCSPEKIKNIIPLKRHAIESPALVVKKMRKVDDTPTPIPKARASLFRDAEVLDLTLSAKSFYKSTKKRSHSVDCGDDDGNGRGVAISVPDDSNLSVKKRKRHSLSSHTPNHNYHKRGPRKVAISARNSLGGMNAGVKHGIKKPKIKRHVSRVEAFKKEKQKSTIMGHKEDRNKECDRGGLNRKRIIVNNGPKLSSIPNTTNTMDVDRPVKSFESHQAAKVTVNDTITPTVSNGMIALNKNYSQMTGNPCERAQLEDMSFDTTDLMVDEINLDTSMDKRNVVDGILKVLEDDWADDDYDTMETLKPSFISPIKYHTTSNCELMSPASELSNLTLLLNIDSNSSNVPMASVDDSNSPMRFYPIFTKGYSSSIVNENSATNSFMYMKHVGSRENDKNSSQRLRRPWQTSTKAGGAENQYQIDAGQKKFGAAFCNECGIVYQLGDPEDENVHLNYHNNVKTLKFNGWKNERNIAKDALTNSRIVVIEPGDPKHHWNKVEQVLAVVDDDLGLADVEMSDYRNKKIYFYVRDKMILGVMVVESIKTAHRMIPEFAELNCCSKEATPAKCGINVIWTALSHRRRHIATKLLDALRTHYFFGYVMTLDDIAFSMPTPAGKLFAENYTKTRNFKVYS